MHGSEMDYFSSLFKFVCTGAKECGVVASLPWRELDGADHARPLCGFTFSFVLRLQISMVIPRYWCAPFVVKLPNSANP